MIGGRWWLAELIPNRYYRWEYEVVRIDIDPIDEYTRFCLQGLSHAESSWYYGRGIGRNSGNDFLISKINLDPRTFTFDHDDHHLQLLHHYHKHIVSIVKRDASSAKKHRASKKNPCPSLSSLSFPRRYPPIFCHLLH